MAASDGISAELAAQHATFDDLGLGLPSQTCLKNPIPCISSLKTSSCVKFSVGGQLWFLQTISANVDS
ncbi:hypothetical protein YC2023_084493 [Brassica napus]